MLVLANLAAIALPAFLSQRSKAHDAKAKEMAHTTQVAMETCAANGTGSYTNCNLTALRAIESSIPTAGVTPTELGAGYKITVAATSGNTYSVNRSTAGALTFTCTVAGT